MKIQRTGYLKKILRSLKFNPVTALIGSRQSGKTTLAREIAAQYEKEGQDVHYFDLEHTEHLLSLENPLRTLESLQGLVVIDEVQRKADLFPILRVLSDREPLPAQFLILGSASGELLRQSSESLAGRIQYIELPGFGINEISSTAYDELWIRGGYPKAFLAPDAEDAYNWKDQFIQTFLEKDIAMLGLRVPPSQIGRFWHMLAHYHGQTCNYSDIARSLNVSHTTIRTYLDILTDTFMVRQLAPWFENTSKSMVKSPKIYIRDSGLLHNLFFIRDIDELRRHPKLGASWEGFALEQILRTSNQGRNAYFWATHGGAELDLVLNIRGQRWGFEVKHTDAPRSTKSMAVALKVLELDRLYVVYPGKTTYFINDNIQALPLIELNSIQFQ